MVVLGTRIAETIHNAFDLYEMNPGFGIESVEFCGALVGDGAVGPFPQESSGDMLIVPELIPGAFDDFPPQIQRSIIGSVADVPDVGVFRVDHWILGPAEVV